MTGDTRVLVWLGALLCAAGGLAPATGNVDLRFSPPAGSAALCNVVEIDLVAASDNPENASVGAVDAILIWDPVRLELLGVDFSSAGYSWMLAGFAPNADGLNEGLEVPWTGVPRNDGNAIFTALAQPGNPALVPAGGLVVTTIRFRAIGESAASTVSLLASYGQWSYTRVLADTPPNTDITGDISGTSVQEIVHVAVMGDMNCDCVINGQDIDGFVYVLFGTAPYTQYYEWTGGGCNHLNADMNGDGLVNGQDIDGFVAALFGG